jgi:hypothetical protein
MKYSLSLAFLTSAVVSQLDISSLIPNYQCNTPLECNAINIILGNPLNLIKGASCVSKSTDNEKLQCGLESTGLSNDQAQNFIKRKPLADKCVKMNDTLSSCIKACSGDNKESCVNKCFEPTLNDYYSCLAKEAKLDNFDSKKAIDCGNSCTQSDLSDLFNCDYKCNESLYKKLTGDNLEVKNDKNSTESSSTTKPNSASKASLTKFGAGLVVVSSVLSLL